MIKNYEEIKDYILKNEGITLDIETMKNTTKKIGYIVNIQDYEYVTDRIDDIMDMIKNYEEIIKMLETKTKNKYFIGVWYNKEDNNYYLDISKHILNVRDAKKFGQANFQKAIYSLSKNESVYLNYEVVYYAVYKYIKNSLGQVIDEVIVGTYDTKKEVCNILNVTLSQLSRILNKKSSSDSYNVYQFAVNIKEL